MSEEQAVLVERQGHVMLVTLNRPDARNAINHAIWVGAGSALAEAEADVEVRAVIITGAGDKSFCAGADLKALSRGEQIAPSDPVQLGWGFAGIVGHPISKPVIAAVNGTALGGGTEIALACDLVVAVDTAEFGLPEVKRGIVAGAGGAFRIVQQLPKKIAREMLLTGDPIGAARALDLGLINAVVPREALIDAAMALAERIALNAPLSVQASKRIALGIVDGRIAGDDAGWSQTHRESAVLMRSEDAREGPRAFAEKRAPQWKGR
ncbi:MAG: enoyl-CoA hydratase-related protein [Sphingobium sp.]